MNSDLNSDRLDELIYIYASKNQAVFHPEKVKFLDEIAYLAGKSAFKLGREEALYAGDIVLKHLEHYWLCSIAADDHDGWRSGAIEIFKILSCRKNSP